jgi:hypothetical protein
MLGMSDARTEALFSYVGCDARVPMDHPLPIRHIVNDAREALRDCRQPRASEELIGERVHTFAYPFGGVDDAAAACVRDSGFACACTTNLGRASIQTDPMRLPSRRSRQLGGR